MVYKGIKLHKNSTAYQLALDKSPEGIKKLEKHMQLILKQYKELVNAD